MKKISPLLISTVILLMGCGGDNLSLDNSGQKIEDDDKDTIINTLDNCPFIANTDQFDSNNNGVGDVCESSQNAREKAVQVISQFAKSQGTSNIPTVSDYNDAGVIGVNSENLFRINQQVLKLTKLDVNMINKIQKIVNSEIDNNLINHAPKANNVIIEGTPNLGQLLTLNYTYVDIDNDAEGNSLIVWSTSAVEIQRGSNKTFLIPANFVGSTISASVYPVDEHGLKGEKFFASNNGVTITEPVNHAPKASNVIIEGIPNLGQSLTLNYTYADIDNDAEGSSLIVWSTPTVELARGNNKTFFIPENFVGKIINASVYPVDEHGLKGEQFFASNNGVTIAEPINHAPKASNVIIEGTPNLGKLLTLNYTYADIDNDAEGSSLIVWSTPTAELQRSSNKTFLIPNNFVGKVINASVYPVDEHGLKGEKFFASNNGITISEPINHAPKASNVTIEGTLNLGQTLTLNYTYADIDNDAEGNSLIVWSTPAAEIQRGSNKTFLIPANFVGSAISASVYPVDKNGLKGEQVFASNNGAAVEMNPIFGARSVIPTPLSEGDLFASPSGSGNVCTKLVPCSLQIATKKLKSGDVLFLRGGVYDSFNYTDGTNINDFFKVHISQSQGGSKEDPTIIESYPGEWAIIDGGNLKDLETAGRADDSYGLLRIWYTNYVYFRLFEVKNAPGSGVNITGDNNRVEGVISHHNRGTGISIYNGAHISVTDSIVFNNSDTIAHVGLISPDRNGFNFPYNDGDHADGISAVRATYTDIAHNTVYSNSDDGIDTFTHGGTYTFVEVSYNAIYQNGDGKNGGGAGIKLGIGGGNYAHNNVIFKNKSDALLDNGGKYNRWKYNTAWRNGRGVQTAVEAILEGNILAENMSIGWHNGNQINNSWQTVGEVQFVSTRFGSTDFLKPKVGLGFDNMGAYINPMPSNINKPVPLFIIGDSTVDNQTKVNGNRVEMGWGNVISDIMIDPSLKHNHARSGASSLSINNVPSYSSNRFWGDGKTMGPYNRKGAQQNILEMDTTVGGFLMMQFGHNDVSLTDEINILSHTVPEKNLTVLSNPPLGLTSFESHLRKYIDSALLKNITPVLITPVSRMNPWRSYCSEFNGMPACDPAHVYEIKASNNPFKGQIFDYPQAMKDLQQEYRSKGKNVLLLDLTTASMKHYRNTIAPGEIKATKDFVMSKYAYDDSTHFNAEGAAMIAGLIKELSCDKNDGDAGLCSQFK